MLIPLFFSFGDFAVGSGEMFGANMEQQRLISRKLKHNCCLLSATSADGKASKLFHFCHIIMTANNGAYYFILFDFIFQNMDACICVCMLSVKWFTTSISPEGMIFYGCLMDVLSHFAITLYQYLHIKVNEKLFVVYAMQLRTPRSLVYIHTRRSILICLDKLHRLQISVELKPNRERKNKNVCVPLRLSLFSHCLMLRYPQVVKTRHA